MTDAPRTPSALARVVAGAAAGSAFEWYDFLVFGSLAAVLARNFFAGLDPTLGLVMTLGAFGAGFAARPLGGLVFGRIGDARGRKGAFLATILVMGASTFLVGLLPTYAQAGPLAPILLVTLRLLQGFALGGEYAGAAIYVAEHAPAGRRGLLTSWIQASAAVGLLAALVLVYALRTGLGEARFAEWGWRIPFLASSLLVALSVAVRARLDETPLFRRMKAEAKTSSTPLAETFGQWPHVRQMLLALFGFMAAQGAVFYTGFFYVPFYMERVLGAPGATVDLLMMAAVAVSGGLYVAFGWLSDRLGRRPVMLFGMAVAALGFFPAFHLLAQAADPGLADAARRAPIALASPPGACSFQFHPLGSAGSASACDAAAGALVGAGAPYRHVRGSGPSVVVSIGPERLELPAGTPADLIRAKVLSAVRRAGYPAPADRRPMDLPLVLAALAVFVVAATALYGPLAAALVELFPPRIRYTALALPYHIGSGWIGGFMPAAAFAVTAATGDLYAALWIPVGLTLVSAVVTLAWMRETAEGRWREPAGPDRQTGAHAGEACRARAPY